MVYTLNHYFYNSKRIDSMKKNINNTDKLVRFLMATGIALFIYFGIIIGTVASILLLIIALFLLITVLMNFCPIYNLLGLNNYKPKE